MDLLYLVRSLVPIALLFLILDIPWLWVSSTYAQEMIKRVQGGMPMRVRWETAPPVYLALAYILLQTQSTIQTFFVGLATYAVYDFTNLSTLTNYTVEFAIADSLWGGILFSIVRYVAIRLNLM
jgi:uncharacterized membrane protein